MSIHLEVLKSVDKLLTGNGALDPLAEDFGEIAGDQAITERIATARLRNTASGMLQMVIDGASTHGAFNITEPNGVLLFVSSQLAGQLTNLARQTPKITDYQKVYMDFSSKFRRTPPDIMEQLMAHLMDNGIPPDIAVPSTVTSEAFNAVYKDPVVSDLLEALAIPVIQMLAAGDRIPLGMKLAGISLAYAGFLIGPFYTEFNNMVDRQMETIHAMNRAIASNPNSKRIEWIEKLTSKNMEGYKKSIVLDWVINAFPVLSAGVGMMLTEPGSAFGIWRAVQQTLGETVSTIRGLSEIPSRKRAAEVIKLSMEWLINGPYLATSAVWDKWRIENPITTVGIEEKDGDLLMLKEFVGIVAENSSPALTLNLRRGQVVFLTGSSGVGKSNTVHGLRGYAPSKGGAYIAKEGGGLHPITTCPRPELESLITYFHQDRYGIKGKRFVDLINDRWLNELATDSLPMQILWALSLDDAMLEKQLAMYQGRAEKSNADNEPDSSSNGNNNAWDAKLFGPLTPDSIEHIIELRQARFQYAAEMMKIMGDNFEGKLPTFPLAQMSTGMRARALVMQAWLEETPIIILDDPFGTVDQKNAQEIWEHVLRSPEMKERAVIIITQAHQTELISSATNILEKENVQEIVLNNSTN